MTYYLAITIDTECDKGEKWHVKQPLSFENIYKGVSCVLQPLFKEFGIKPTYLLSPEVINDKDSVSFFSSLGDKAELGTHLHSEFIEPKTSFDCIKTDHFQADFPSEIEWQKLKNITELFKTAFHHAPRSFRAGRFGASNLTASFLEKLGYWVDSSVSPARWWKSDLGTRVSYLGIDAYPYHPCDFDIKNSGALQIVEWPVTILNNLPASFRLSIIRHFNPFNRLQMAVLFRLVRLFGGDMGVRWLRPTYSTEEEMLSITKEMKANQHGHVFLNMMFHSNEFTVGTSPYSLDETSVQQNIKRLRGYFELIQQTFDVHSIGMSEIKGLI